MVGGIDQSLSVSSSGKERSPGEWPLASATSRLLVFALAVAGIVAVLRAMTWGPWVGSDSVEHLEAARNLASGKGLVLVRASGNVVPLYGRPPLYSLLLALGIAAGVDPVGGVRVLNACLYGLLIASSGFLLLRAIHRPVLPILAAAFLLTEPFLLGSFAGMMTEPLFFAIAGGFLLTLTLYLHRGASRLLWLSAGLAALALLTRFVGAACILLLGMAIMVRGPAPWPRRTFLAAVVTVAATAPYLTWAATLLSQGGGPGVYDFDWPTARQAFGNARVAILEAMWSWYPLLQAAGDFSYRLRMAATGLVAVVGIGWVSWLSRRYRAATWPGQAWALYGGAVLTTYSVMHLALVAATYAVVAFPRPELNERVLLPSKLALVIGMPLLAEYVARVLRRTWFALGLSVLLLAPQVVVGVQRTAGVLQDLEANGRGYTGRAWSDLPILARLAQLPPSAPIVSNDIDAVMFFLERPAYRLPDLEERVPEEEWTAFGAGRGSQAEREFVEKDGYLVIFPSALGQLADVYRGLAQSRLDSLLRGLNVVYEGFDGGIYGPGVDGSGAGS